jgi:hypothetical protein
MLGDEPRTEDLTPFPSSSFFKKKTLQQKPTTLLFHAFPSHIPACDYNMRDITITPSLYKHHHII